MKKQQFAQKMIDILNYGALNLAMGIGYKTGLFDVMADLDRPASAREIADRAKLNHRYVLEWLSIMATGGIIEIRPGPFKALHYYLPPEHALSLTRKSNDTNLGVYTQEIPLLTQCAMEKVTQDFVHGKGISFSSYPQFQSFMGELSNAKHEKVLIQQFLPEVDDGKLIERLSAGIRVCDLGCGEGVALFLMARQFPRSLFTGIDTHEQALHTARQNAGQYCLENIDFINQDAAEIAGRPEFENRFDYILAFDAIHDQTRPLDALKGIHYMLARGGFFSMIDIDAHSDVLNNLDHPMGPFLYTVSLMHCMPIGLRGGGSGLGMMWGRDQAVALLKEAGFHKITLCKMAHDPFNVHYFCA